VFELVDLNIFVVCYNRFSLIWFVC